MSLILVQIGIATAAFTASVLMRDRNKRKLNRDSITRDDVPLANEGDPIPLVLGKQLVKTPNTVWYGLAKDVSAVEAFETSPWDNFVTWKAGNSSKIGEVAYVGIDMAVCVGTDVELEGLYINGRPPIDGFHALDPNDSHADDLATQSQATVPSENIITQMQPMDIPNTEYAHLGTGWAYLTWYDGNTSQPSLYDKFSGLGVPSNYPKMRGVAHAALWDWSVDARNISLPPLWFEVSRYTSGLGLSNDDLILTNGGINPAEVLYQLLTDPLHGLGLNPSTYISSSFTDVAEVLAEEQHGMGFLLAQKLSVQEIIGEILDQIDGVLYQETIGADAGKLVLKLIRDDYNENSLLNLDPSNVIEVNHFSKSGWQDTYNHIHMVYTEPSNVYEPVDIYVYDNANIQFTGGVRSLKLDYPWVIDVGTANKIARRELGIMSSPLSKLRITCNREAADLRPGDVFTFTWKDYGVWNKVFRVAKYSKGDAGDNTIIIDAVGDRYADLSGLSSDPSTGWSALEYIPDHVDDYETFETPFWLLRKKDASLRSGDASTPSTFTYLVRQPAPADAKNSVSSFSVYASDDDGLVTSYMDGSLSGEELSKVKPTASAIVQSTITPSTSQNEGVLSSVSLTNMRTSFFFRQNTKDAIRKYGRGLCYCNGEFLAYEGIENTSGDNYTLTNVYRALLDTTFETLTGKTIYFLDGSARWSSIVDHGQGDQLRYNPRWVDQDPVYYFHKEYHGMYSADPATALIHTVTGDRRAIRPMPPTYLEVTTTSSTVFERNPTASITAHAGMRLRWRVRTKGHSRMSLLNDPSET
jgi:hypothetical protein